MSKIEDYINEATSRLKGDTEIQIEVQQELRSHIEASIDDTTEGESADEAEERALEEMGSAELIKEDLLETHVSSMKWKGRLFFVAQAITIPILMIVMTWSLWSDSFISWFPVGDKQFPFSPMYAGEPDNSESHINEFIEKWREEQSEENFYQVYNKIGWNRENIHIFKKELKLAQQLNPSNAWLDFVSVSCLSRYEMQDFSMRLDPKDEKVHVKYEELWNNEKVQECLLILKNAAEKTDYKPYMINSVYQIQDNMMEDLSSVTYANYIREFSSFSFSESLMSLDLSNLLIYHLSTLNFNEHKAEIEGHINTLTQMVNLIRQNNALVSHLVSIAIIKRLKKQLENSIEIQLLNEGTRGKLNKLFAFSKELEDWDRKKDDIQNSVELESKYYGSSMFSEETSVLMVPDAHYVNEFIDYNEYRNEWRRLSFSIIDRHVIQLATLFISIGAIFLYLKIFLNKKKSTYPHLKLRLKNSKTMGCILLSIIVPLVVYSLLFIFNEYGSRGWSFQFNTPHMALEIITLVSTIVLLPLYFISVQVSKRCEEIGIDAESPSKLSKITLFLLAGCWVYLFVSKPNYLAYESMWDSWQNKVALILCIALTSLFVYKICNAIFTSIFKKKKDHTYAVTSARAKIVYAILPLMVCLFVSNQLMKIHERKQINQAIHSESGEPILWLKTEHEVCEYFKGRFDEIFGEE